MKRPTRSLSSLLFDGWAITENLGWINDRFFELRIVAQRPNWTSLNASVYISRGEWEKNSEPIELLERKRNVIYRELAQQARQIESGAERPKKDRWIAECPKDYMPPFGWKE